ncbi:MAG: DUF4349 domain-containing protein [bacterium]|nr:DUF4349 domain-containing protein [bacterium]
MAQPVSRKNYFLLACLIAFVVIVISAAAKVMLIGNERTSSLSKSSRGYNSTGIMSRDGDMYAQPESKMMYPTEDIGQASDLLAPGFPIRPPTDSTPVAGGDRKIIKNGNVSVVVKDVDQAAKSIESKAKELGGYLSSTNLNSSGKVNKSGYISARIPVERVNDFIAHLKTSSVKVTNENINSDDVTSEFIDLQAKITNSESTAAQYRELLKRAVKVEEVLQVQKELNSIQSSIDSYKGQLKYLEGNAALSNITVNLAIDEGELPIAPENRWEPGNVFKASVRSLTTMAQNLSYTAIALAVYAVVWVPITIGLVILYKLLRRKIR